MKISIEADFIPDLQWAEDFESFSGSERIGEQGNPASATITIYAGGAGFPYDVDFYSYREVTGTRCSGCTPCE
jgi:hypothetical protein